MPSNLCAGKKPEVKKEEKKQTAPALAPTKANVPYGTHERQVLDFYQAKSEKPTPVVFYIHGGGWQNGDKKVLGQSLSSMRAYPLLQSTTGM